MGPPILGRRQDLSAEPSPETNPRAIPGVHARADRSTPATHEELLQENEQLAARTRELEQEVQDLQEKVASTGPAAGESFIDPPQEQLQAMVKRCEISYDTPPLGSTPTGVSEGRSRELGLNETEQAAITKVLAENHRRTVALLRQLYIEATGQSQVADALSPGAMMNEIDDKTREDQKKEIFQRLARERAGLAKPPADLDALSPGERMYRMLTTMGDRIEREMSQEIGPDLARRYRELKGGFGSRWRHRNGCPQP